MSRFRDDSELTRLNRRAPQSARHLADARAGTDGGGPGPPGHGWSVRPAGRRSTSNGSATPAVPQACRPGVGAPDASGRILRSRRAGPRPGRVCTRRWTSAGSARAWRSAGPPTRSTASVVGRRSRRSLLDAGGDLVASGPPPAAHRGSIGDRGPGRRDRARRRRRPIAIEAGSRPRRSASAALASTDGRTVHHLIDPRTGEPGGDGLAAVTVARPGPGLGRGLVEGALPRGRARDRRDVARARGLAAWWVTTDGELLDDAGGPVSGRAWVAAEAGRRARPRRRAARPSARP